MHTTFRDRVRMESVATRWAVSAFAIAAIMTIVVMWGERWPLAGQTLSVGNLAAWAAAAFAGAAFAASFVVESRRGYDAWRRRMPLAKRILDVAAMTAAMAMLSYLVVQAVASLFQQGFFGMDIDPLGGGALVGASVAAFTYAAFLSGSRVTADGLAMLATLVLFTGTMASMLSTPDLSWWQLHFSQLGNSDQASGYRFNLALILTGLVVTVLANYVGRDVELGLIARGAEPKRRTRQLSWLFAGIGICLTIAGLVPDAVSIPIHVGAASGMVVLFVVFVVCALRFLPGLPREVSGFSLLVIIGIVVAIALWIPIGYYNLTGMEFIAAGLLFAWLLYFVRAIGVYARADAPAVAPSDAAAAAQR
ncbi:DUF998 domain-containing protein [Microbacterium bovistercoris]|uniref:DUF998 domain-containing protein n=1 Tax=Microbacterium bovistercoris TaxID=2293570 RepID=A0A371NR62_9MICO|nr:DUF998 domain-containing protein [Microbacterium bovistercoris]REJ04125.1 DUF998 domain-containing protein [Microbacterium bovistercoris]